MIKCKSQKIKSFWVNKLVIDEDYRGQAFVPLHNHSDMPQEIVHGDRIAQFMFVPYYQAQFDVVDELDETDRGVGGFGSTGVR